MEKISISDFRAHIKQYLDEMTDIKEDGSYTISPYNLDSIRQLGDVRNNTRVLICSQSAFQHQMTEYYCFKSYSECLQAMDLKNMAILMNAPKLKNTPICILNSLQTLFDATQAILDIILHEYPYTIFNELDVSPICAHLTSNYQQRMSADVPLSLYTFARFLQNTYQILSKDIITKEEPIMLMSLVESLSDSSPLKLTFNHDIMSCTSDEQDILKQAIRSAQHLLYRVLSYASDQNGMEKLLAWHALYISKDAPIDRTSRLWKHLHDMAIK